jgi:hypothetical protein
MACLATSYPTHSSRGSLGASLIENNCLQHTVTLLSYSRGSTLNRSEKEWHRRENCDGKKTERCVSN